MMSILETTALTHAYNSNIVLSTTPVALPEGEHMLILGESGSGKTTLLSLIAGMQMPTEGEVRVAEQNLADLKPAERDVFRGQTMGIIFQKLYLIESLTAWQNVMLAAGLVQGSMGVHEVEELFDKLDIAHVKHHKPRALSVGQAQRVAIARALVSKPQVILADEPTSALDNKHAEHAMTLLLEQASAHGATLIVATHDQRITPLFADNILHLNAREGEAS